MLPALDAPRRMPAEVDLTLLWSGLILLLLGTVMDMAPLILILTPILLPVITGIGVDPVHFGMIMLVKDKGSDIAILRTMGAVSSLITYFLSTIL